MTTTYQAMIQQRIDDAAAKVTATDEDKAAVDAMIDDNTVPGSARFDFGNDRIWTTAAKVTPTLEEMTPVHRANVVFMLENWVEDDELWREHLSSIALTMLLDGASVREIRETVEPLAATRAVADLYRTPLIRRLFALGTQKPGPPNKVSDGATTESTSRAATTVYNDQTT